VFVSRIILQNKAEWKGRGDGNSFGFFKDHWIGQRQDFVHPSSFKKLPVWWYGCLVVVNACNPSTWEAEAGGSQVQDQPGLHSETLSLKKDGMGQGRS
jgi:hypothetical protein